MKTRLLFICTLNRHRSATAEALFQRSEKYQARSAGLSPLSAQEVNAELLEWADLVFVMDERIDRHRSELLTRFPAMEQLKEKVIVLGVPDIYDRDSPELIMLLRQRLRLWLPDLDV
jgi:protein-tyrosine phosphatase